MSTRRRIEITCEICGYQADYDCLGSAWADGWKRDRWSNGWNVDLCAGCAAKCLDPKLDCPFCHEPLDEHTERERRSCEMDVERRDLESRFRG